MTSNKEQKLKVAIAILSVLLAISLAALIYMVVRFDGSTPVVIPDNLITTGSMAGTDAQEGTVPAVRIHARKVDVLGVFQDTDGNSKDWISDDEDILKIYDGQEYDQDRFSAKNMFPGDEIKKEYLVQVWHEGEVDVDFTIENITSLTDEQKKALLKEDLSLVEVLQYDIKAEVLNVNGSKYISTDRNKEAKGTMWEYVGGEYEGDPQKTITVTTPPSDGVKPTEILYTITMFLDGPTVTNEYMNKHLYMDFKWSVPDTIEDEPETQKPTSGRDDDDDDDRKPTSSVTPTDSITDMTTAPSEPSEPGHLVKPPKTGDNTILIFGAALAAGALLIILIIAKRRKEEEDET